MDEPTKPEVGDPTTLNDVKNKDSHEQFDPFQEPENSPQDITDEFSKAMATALPDVLADISTDPGVVSRLRAFLAIVREETFRFMDPNEPPFLSQFFNFTEIEIKDADCSNDDFAEYKSFVQTAGEVGRRTTLTDYLIARKFQPLVQVRSMLRYTTILTSNCFVAATSSGLHHCTDGSATRRPQASKALCGIYCLWPTLLRNA
jgi:hypothetical protein